MYTVGRDEVAWRIFLRSIIYFFYAVMECFHLAVYAFSQVAATCIWLPEKFAKSKHLTE